MKNLTRKKYIKLVATALNEAYGNTLVEDNTDIQLAEKVIGCLKPYLCFSRETKKSTKVYCDWVKSRIEQK